MDILTLFGFTQLTLIIPVVCIMMMLGSFLGGLLRGIILAMGGPIRPRKLFERMSFRAILMGEIFVGGFAGYYHGIIIESIELTHMVYWGFTLLAAPVLAFIGAQITGLIYAEKIEANIKAYAEWVKAQRNKKKNAPKKQRKAQRSSQSFDPSTT